MEKQIIEAEVEVFEISDEHKEEINQMTDNDVVEVWKIYMSKAKRLNKTSKAGQEAQAIANFAMRKHKENRSSMVI